MAFCTSLICRNFRGVTGRNQTCRKIPFGKWVTGHTPCRIEYLSTVIWNSPSDLKFPGVVKFAQRVKLAIMAAHDSIIAARVKQIRDSNRHRRVVPFVGGDLVYISTKNLSLKKGLARKLSPKFIGPYRIIKDFRNNSFMIDLPPEMKQRGIHPVYHAQYLRIHHPNDDHLFLGRSYSQLGLAESLESEWKIDKILSHSGNGERAQFEIQWTAGDITWLPYDEAKKLVAFQDYLDTLGISDVAQLKQPIPTHGSVVSITDKQIGCITLKPGDKFVCVASVSCSAVSMSDEPLKLNFCSRSENGAILFVGQGLEPSLQLSRPIFEEYLAYDRAVRGGNLAGQGPPPGYLAVRAVFLNEVNLPGSLAIWTVDNKVEARGEPLTVQHIFGPVQAPSIPPPPVPSVTQDPMVANSATPLPFTPLSQPDTPDPFDLSAFAALDFSLDIPTTTDTPTPSHGQYRGRGRGRGRGGNRGRGHGRGYGHVNSSSTSANRNPAAYWETRRLAIADRAVYEAADRLQRLEDLWQLHKDRRIEEREEMARKQAQKDNRPRRGRGGRKNEGTPLALTSTAPSASTSTIPSSAPSPASSQSAPTSTPTSQILITPLLPTPTLSIAQSLINSMDLDGNTGSVQDICNDIDSLLEPGSEV
jgi:hypothetical protein